MITIDSKTSHLLEKYPFHSQRGKKENSVVIAAFKNPLGEDRWYAVECEKKGEDYLFYGCCFLLKKWMWGMFSLAHLQAIKLPYGFHLEMDEGLSLKPLNQIPQTPYFKRQSSVRKELKYEPSV